MSVLARQHTCSSGDQINFQKGWFLVDDLGEKYVLSSYDDANRFNVLLKAVDLILQIQQIKDPEIEPYSRDDSLWNLTYSTTGSWPNG